MTAQDQPPPSPDAAIFNPLKLEEAAQILRVGLERGRARAGAADPLDTEQALQEDS
jgi:hypothetical protein